MSLLKVRILGTAGSGKRSLRKVICKSFPVPNADEWDEDDDDGAEPRQAYINNQTTVVVTEDIETEEENPLSKDDESASLMPKGVGNKAALGKPKGPQLKKPKQLTRKVEKLGVKKSSGGGGQGVSREEKREQEDERYDVSYMIVFDIGDQDSFSAAEKLIADLVAEKNMQAVLIGNKTDKKRSYRRIAYDEGSALGRTYDIPYIEASAKLNQNVDRAFMTLVKKLQTALIRPDVEADKSWGYGLLKGSGGNKGKPAPTKTASGGDGDDDDKEAPPTGIPEDAQGATLDVCGCWAKCFKTIRKACRRCWKTCTSCCKRGEGNDPP